MTKRGQKRESKYLLGGNNAIKSNQEEFLETYVLCSMYTISSHANSRFRIYLCKWVGSAKSFCLYIGKFVYTFVT